MKTKSASPKKALDLRRAKRFVDSVDEGDNLVSPLEWKEKDELAKTTKEP
jgi:hypothetical protein